MGDLRHAMPIKEIAEAIIHLFEAKVLCGFTVASTLANGGLVLGGFTGLVGAPIAFIFVSHLPSPH
jgi:hypothetical protein